MHLPVLTYNIHSGVGIDGVLDLDRIAAVIAGSGAELVALQEVDRYRRELQRLRRPAGATSPTGSGCTSRMPRAWTTSPSTRARGGRSTGPPCSAPAGWSDVSTTLLPCFPGSEQRGLLEATVELGGASLRVLGTHLQWDREDERLAQARAVTAALDDRPTLLLGDLNTTPGSATYEHLATRLDDSWARVGDGDGHTFDAELPPRRIDYVWVGGGVRALGAQVLPSPASDHAALLVDVEVPAPPA